MTALLTCHVMKVPRNSAGAGSDSLDYEGMVVELLGSVDSMTGEYAFGEKIERRGKYYEYRLASGRRGRITQPRKTLADLCTWTFSV